jgi:hypothetical protein
MDAVRLLENVDDVDHGLGRYRVTVRPSPPLAKCVGEFTELVDVGVAECHLLSHVQRVSRLLSFCTSVSAVVIDSRVPDRLSGGFVVGEGDFPTAYGVAALPSQWA